MLLVFFIACVVKNPTHLRNHNTLPPANLAKRIRVVERLQGEKVADPYRWMEKYRDPYIDNWVSGHNQMFEIYSELLPQKKWLHSRLQDMLLHDQQSVPTPCPERTSRSIIWKKPKQQRNWVAYLQVNNQEKVLLDPNTWSTKDELYGFFPSPDCSFVAFGRAKNKHQQVQMRILETSTGRLLSDTLQGWKQEKVSWLPDSSGFYYSALPLSHEAPNQDKNHYQRLFFHKIAEASHKDKLIIYDNSIKQHQHDATVTEKGRYVLIRRSTQQKSQIFLLDRQKKNKKRIPLTLQADAQHHALLIGTKIYIHTNWQAPRYRVMVTSIDKPQREHWQELLPQDTDILVSWHAIGGYFYAIYQRNARQLVKVYNRNGIFQHEIDLPVNGQVRLRGTWRDKYAYLFVTSFLHPEEIYRYHAKKNDLQLYQMSPFKVDVANMTSRQVFYNSSDGTRVSMFLLLPKQYSPKQKIPFLLTGYGGFNVSVRPQFSALYALWVEAGGGIAIPNLRGGGEYGEEWYQAGVQQNKPNTVKDFISAADYLIAEQYTNNKQLAIAGTQSGGFVVSAALIQRPNLFQAVLCQNPITDIMRYQRLGLGSYWFEEYGLLQDPQSVTKALAFSPYHNTKAGNNYPALLVTNLVADRSGFVHGSKFFAAIRSADADFGSQQPIMLYMPEFARRMRTSKGDSLLERKARNYAFLMRQVGLEVEE